VYVLCSILHNLWASKLFYLAFDEISFIDLNTFCFIAKRRLTQNIRAVVETLSRAAQKVLGGRVQLSEW